MKNRYEIRGETTAIFIKRRDGVCVETLIDTSDLHKCIALARSISTNKIFEKYYIHCFTGTKQKLIKLHRLVMDAPLDLMVDHINGDPTDNRKVNLRFVNNSENQQNRQGAQRNNKSGVRGVCWHVREGKWIAKIRYMNKNIHIGYFNDIKDAEKSVIEARKKYMTHSVN